MKLFGSYLSPFTRRVAVTLNVLGMPYEHEHFSVFEKPETVRAHNPLVRVPTLVLDDGEALFESYAILDAIDEMAGPGNALTPAGGSARRQVMRLTAVGVGCMDKAQWAYYEGRFHPAEKVHEPWVEHNDRQALGALAHLDRLAADAGDGGWLAAGERLSQADVTAVVAFTFAAAVRPGLDVERAAPALARFARRLEATDAFARAPLPG